MKNMTSTIANYIKTFASVEVLSADKTLELFEAYKNGDEKAFALLVNSNMKLVVKIASRYKDYDVDFGDLVSVGKVGLIKAIENWDPDKSLLTVTLAGGLRKPCANCATVCMSCIRKHSTALRTMKKRLAFKALALTKNAMAMKMACPLAIPSRTIKTIQPMNTKRKTCFSPR